MTTTPIPTGPNPAGTAGPNKLLIALIAVGGVLLLTVVAIVFLLIGQNSSGGVNAGDQTPLPVATDTASPAPTAEGDGGGGGGGQPADNSLRFTSFDYDPTVECDSSGQADEKAQPSISWSSANAVAVYWTPNDREATSENGYQVGGSGNQNDLSDSKGQGERYEFPCNHDQYFDTTITLVGPNGQTVSETAHFEDVNWGSGGGDDDE